MILWYFFVEKTFFMYVQEVLILMFLRRTYTVFKSVFICKLKIDGRWESQIRGSLISVYIPWIFSPTDLTDLHRLSISNTYIYIWTRDSSKTHWPKGSNLTNHSTPLVVAKLTTKSVESHVQEISLISLIRIQK